MAGFGDDATDLEDVGGDEETEEQEQLDSGYPEEEGHGPFPSDEYIALADSLTQLHVANFAPDRLLEAVNAAGGRGVQQAPSYGCRVCALCAACCALCALRVQLLLHAAGAHCMLCGRVLLI